MLMAKLRQVEGEEMYLGFTTLSHNNFDNLLWSAKDNTTGQLQYWLPIQPDIQLVWPYDTWRLVSLII